MGTSKLTNSQISEIIWRHHKGETQRAIAKRFNISQAAVSYWFHEKQLGAAAIAQIRYLKHRNHLLQRQVNLLKKLRQAATEVIYQLEPNIRRRSLFVPLIRAKHRFNRLQANSVVGLRPAAGGVSHAADRALIDLMWKYLAQHPYAGFETLFRVLRHGMPGTRERALRLYLEAFPRARDRLKIAPTTRLPRPHMPAQAALNKMWSIDFMQSKLVDGSSFWILTGLDDFNREGLFVKVVARRSAKAVIEAVSILMAAGRKPAAIRSDNGTEFKSIAYKGFLKAESIKRTHSRFYTSTDNAYIENFNKYVRYDVLKRGSFSSLRDVQSAIDEWVLHYNFARPQKPLGGLSPAQFAYVASTSV